MNIMSRISSTLLMARVILNTSAVVHRSLLTVLFVAYFGKKKVGIHIGLSLFFFFLG
jgi:hypothetical protein